MRLVSGMDLSGIALAILITGWYCLILSALYCLPLRHKRTPVYNFAFSYLGSKLN
jgi:hypothetical protein